MATSNMCFSGALGSAGDGDQRIAVFALIFQCEAFGQGGRAALFPNDQRLRGKPVACARDVERRFAHGFTIGRVKEYHVKGPVMIMLTTTAIDLDEELQNRCLTLAVDDSPEQTARIQAERQTFEVEDCRRRVEKYPNDLLIRFELGELYFKAGKITEAIQEFQKAQANPNKRLQAMGYLGQCFARRGMNDLAARTFQNAIKEKGPFDEEKKDLIYQLGCTFEKMGKREEAIEQFKIIYESDIGYKDVAAKVDSYYSSGG